MMKNIFKVMVIVLLAFATCYSALAEDNLLNSNWMRGGNALTVTQGDTAELNLEVLSAGNTVYLQVRLLGSDGNLIRYLENNFPVYSRGVWEGQLTIDTADLLGNYDVEVEVINWNGVADQETLYLHVEDDNHAPTYRIYPQPDFGDFGAYLRYEAGEDIEITVDGYDADGDGLKFTLATRDSRYVLPSGLHFALDGEDKIVLTGSVAREGSYTIDITVTDGEASYTAPLILIIENINHAPAYTITPAPTPSAFGPYLEYAVNLPLSIFVDGQDEDRDSLIFNVAEINSKLPAGLEARAYSNFNGNDVIISGAPEEAGQFGFLITVSDGELEYSYPLTLVISESIIEEDNTAPVINVLADQNMNEGEVLNIQAAAADAENDELTYQVQRLRNYWFWSMYSSNLHSSMTFNPETGDFTFAPDFDFVDSGSEEVKLRFRAFDGEEYSNWETMVITVNDNDAPRETTLGCTDEAATNYNPAADTNDGSCLYLPEAEVCTDGLDNDADGFVDCADSDCSAAEVCQAPGEEICTNGIDDDSDLLIDCADSDCADHSSCQACADTDSDGVCNEDEVIGCTDETALNYNPLATDDDGSCEYLILVEICYDGLDNDADLLVDCADSDCAESEVCKVTPFIDIPNSNLKIKSVDLSSEEVFPGDYLTLSVSLFNNGEVDLDDASIKVLVYDWNLYISGREFDLGEDKAYNERVYLPVPYDTLPGDYLIEIFVGDDHYHDSTYRMVTVR